MDNERYTELVKTVVLGFVCFYLRQLFMFLFEMELTPLLPGVGVHQVDYTGLGLALVLHLCLLSTETTCMNPLTWLAILQIH